jgi:osmoprotectant transport system permease protein
VLIGVPVGNSVDALSSVAWSSARDRKRDADDSESRLVGFLIPAPVIGGIGTRTALVALVLYSTPADHSQHRDGILNVDPNVREAAVAMGMTSSQVLRQVELPLAMGVIVTGIRVATVIASV